MTIKLGTGCKRAARLVTLWQTCMDHVDGHLVEPRMVFQVGRGTLTFAGQHATLLIKVDPDGSTFTFTHHHSKPNGVELPQPFTLRRQHNDPVPTEVLEVLPIFPPKRSYVRARQGSAEVQVN